MHKLGALLVGVIMTLLSFGSNRDYIDRAPQIAIKRVRFDQISDDFLSTLVPTTDEIDSWERAAIYVQENRAWETRWLAEDSPFTGFYYHMPNFNDTYYMLQLLLDEHDELNEGTALVVFKEKVFYRESINWFFYENSSDWIQDGNTFYKEFELRENHLYALAGLPAIFGIPSFAVTFMIWGFLANSGDLEKFWPFAKKKKE